MRSGLLCNTETAQLRNLDVVGRVIGQAHPAFQPRQQGAAECRSVSRRGRGRTRMPIGRPFVVNERDCEFEYPSTSSLGTGAFASAAPTQAARGLLRNFGRRRGHGFGRALSNSSPVHGVHSRRCTPCVRQHGNRTASTPLRLSLRLVRRRSIRVPVGLVWVARRVTKPSAQTDPRARSDVCRAKGRLHRSISNPGLGNRRSEVSLRSEPQ